LDEKMENNRRNRLGVLEPLAACELDASRSEKETRHVRGGSARANYLFDIRNAAFKCATGLDGHLPGVKDYPLR